MIINVKDKAEIASLNPEQIGEGTVVFIEDEKKYQMFENGVWVDYNPDLKLSLYDMNKGLVASQKNMDWRKVENVIKKWNPQGTYFLMYCKDIGYFTLFKRTEGAPEKFHEVFKDCLVNVGDLKACDITEEGNGLEIWIKPKDSNSAICMYLFNYDEGVVEFNG
jgi:hypothetical protein